MTHPQPPVAVEQCDREAAAEVATAVWGPRHGDYIRDVADDHWLIQTFARHRLAERERCAKVAEAHAAPNGIPTIEYDTACHDIAATIRTGKEPA